MALELLSPAGSPEALRAAVQSGCGAVYLSLGNREEKTANPVMRTVGDRIREGYELMRVRGIRCTLEWNSGGHFKEPDLRTAKAFAWVLENAAV